VIDAGTALPDVVIPPPVDAPVADVIDDVADASDAMTDAGDADDVNDANALTDADDVVSLAGDAGVAGDGGAVEELPPGCQCRAGDTSKPLGRKGLWLLTALLPLLRRRRRVS
jgi:MYXO-CTERM domain-containing protein